jgi:hypothetical protein
VKSAEQRRSFVSAGLRPPDRAIDLPDGAKVVGKVRDAADHAIQLPMGYLAGLRQSL